MVDLELALARQHDCEGPVFSRLRGRQREIGAPPAAAGLRTQILRGQLPAGARQQTGTQVAAQRAEEERESCITGASLQIEALLHEPDLAAGEARHSDLLRRVPLVRVLPIEAAGKRIARIR